VTQILESPHIKITYRKFPKTASLPVTCHLQPVPPAFTCSDYGCFHQTKISLTLFDRPDRLKRLGEVYAPNALPSEVPQLLGMLEMARALGVEGTL
jgi:hypothetical protein